MVNSWSFNLSNVQMKIVWLVLEPTYHGYDDYSIVGIYSTKELAEKHCEDNFKIEEWKVADE